VAASLPRVLICSQCEHGAFIKSTPARSPTAEREERAAERAAGGASHRPPRQAKVKAPRWPGVNAAP
jgi:hypothetical protein